MEPISKTYRRACRETGLPPQEKALFMRLLREISVNAARSRKNWRNKEDFIALWFVSAGRFPELKRNPYREMIGSWIATQLPFELTEQERLELWI
ncbi:MAG TPA: hypothetical protein VGM63_05495 [Mucilaginibacter sp.]|jgi:hypothetical protein